MGVLIETVGLDIDGTKIVLDKQAAKELYLALKELFEDKKVMPYVEYIPIPVYPYYPPIQPWITVTTTGNNTIPYTFIDASSSNALTLT